MELITSFSRTSDETLSDPNCLTIRCNGPPFRAAAGLPREAAEGSAAIGAVALAHGQVRAPVRERARGADGGSVEIRLSHAVSEEADRRSHFLEAGSAD